ncbi:MAG: matrixin family metalloprotease [Deltaproteobacteria bacterium]|nr:matrixin family metalloprotease [Deltaproteobacteria bacterium]
MTLAVLALIALPAFVCTRAGDDGPSIAWDEREVVLRRSGASAELDADDIEAVLERAASTWGRAGDCTDISPRLGAPTDSRLIGFDWAAGTGSPDNENIVVFRNDEEGDELDAWVHAMGALAITTVTWESHSGQLLDADIEVNDSRFHFTACDPGDCAVDFDLENTITHELGHVLGLDHSADATATMYASAPRADLSKRDLASDDVDGICAIYPSGEPMGECYGVERDEPPDVRFSPTLCEGGSTSSSCMLVLALVALRPGRRRRAPGSARLSYADVGVADLPG